MYFYLYDAFLQEKKYSKLLSDIEARLIDLGIQGRTTKLNILNDMKELISDAVHRGAETVVVLGDDKTVSKAINTVAQLNITLGIIPIGSETIFAEHLGIPQGVAAAETLSKRIKERIDIAQVNSNYFALYLKALSPHIRVVSADKEYRITPITSQVEIFVCNFQPKELHKEAADPSSFFKPHDGQLELVIKDAANVSLLGKIFSKGLDKVNGYTILPFKTIRLESARPEEDVRLELDGDKIVKSPVDITVVPGKVEVIVGKMRDF